MDVSHLLCCARRSDESVRSRSQSLSEQLKHADTTKATLISRMARVGQPMLPQLPARTSPLDTCSDSDTEDLDKHAPTMHADKLPTMISQPQPTSQPQPQPQSQPQPQAMPRFQDSSGNPRAQHHPIQLLSRPFVDPESRPSSQHLFAASSNYPFAYVPSTAQAALPSFPPAQQLLLPGMADLAWLVGEMRQHHTDIRLTMGGLSERLDSLGHKVEDVSLNTRQLLDGRPESCGQQQMDHTRLAQLEDDKLHLSREKDKVMVQLQVLEEELKSVKSNLEETQEELKKSKRERGELDRKSEETEKHLQETRADLHQALEQGEFLRTRTVVMKRKFEEELQKRTEDESTQVVKQAMNAVYRCLRHQFAPDETYSGKGVLNCVIAALKNTMMNIVQGGGSEGHDDEGGTEEEHEDSLKKEEEQERMGGTEEECSNCQSEATPESAENDVNGLQPPPVPDAECNDGDHQSCS
uniref:Uncharacterized protein n=1 Tax=Eptatretus burgeri TaxID=7764 RepID=A0A8C4R1N9_EPTBU